MNVLLAEDNELNAEIAAVQLEEFGMNVERAVDGKNAVEIFKDQPEGTFDVILMDIMMPEMNGYEAAKAIRAMNDRPDGKNIPIIAMTANLFAEDVQASLDAGMNAHLSKPIVIDEVIKTILSIAEAKNGKEVLEIFRNSKTGEYDFIIMDVMMPERSRSLP